MGAGINKKRFLIIIIPCVLLACYIYIKFAILFFGPQKKITSVTKSVERGSIVDRNGRPLAVQTNFYHFGVSPKAVKNPKEFSEQICDALDMEALEIENRINDNKDASFIYIRKKITTDMYEELSTIVSENKYTAICRFDKIPGRVYPENSLASQLIGYMGDDGKGLSGIEYSQDEILSPKVTEASPNTVYGDNIYLTIDAALQSKLEKIAQNAMNSTKAENLMLIACQAKTGEILSYISLPSVNLNEYYNATPENSLNRPVVLAYEPGSVFKIFSTAAFLDSGAVAENDSFLCDGIYKRVTNLGETIKITCLGSHGWLNIRTSLKYSCNDALAQMSERIDTDVFLDYLHRFGFGEKTGIELSSETRGNIKKTTDKYWSARSKPTMSIGQELGVSAIQMVQAASIIANQGKKVPLTVIHRIQSKDGTVRQIKNDEPQEQILKPSTAKYILSCMETTAQSGTGSKAALGDISIGVKTGTAQMADTINGGYSTTDFLSNCMAIFPVENPQIILYIVIEKAKGETYAGRIVAPVIAEAANEIIDYLGMERDSAASLEHTGLISISQDKPLEVKDYVPNFIGRPKRDLLPLILDDKILYSIKGEGYVVSQNPEPGTPITENMTIELNLE